MDTPRTLFEKVWDRHVAVHKPGSEDLLYVDWYLINEGGAVLGFDPLRAEVIIGDRLSCPRFCAGVS